MTSELSWRKSSYSGGSGGNCVEVADHDHHVMVRDTKQDGTGPVLRVSPAAWRRFADQIKRSLAADPNRAYRRMDGPLLCLTAGSGPSR
jgi:Domain of unknown function (DUF397)